MNDVATQLVAAQRSLTDLQSQLDIARGQLATANGERETMRSQIQTMTQEVLSLRQRLGPTEAELHARITNLTSERDTLNTQLTAAQTELASTRQTLELANLNIARLTQTKAVFDERVTSQIVSQLTQFGIRKTAVKLPGNDNNGAGGENWTTALMAEKARRAQQGTP